MIAMPDFFRGIHLDPLQPANSFYLLWMILGYLVVSSVLIVSLGRLGDMLGRVRIANLVFVGLVLGGLLAPLDWRMVFLISVPVGLVGTVWGYLRLEERSTPRRAPID